LRWHRRKVKQEMRATSIAFEIGGSSGDELLASISRPRTNAVHAAHVRRLKRTSSGPKHVTTGTLRLLVIRASRLGGPARRYT
jgi:hypothetical protein